MEEADGSFFLPDCLGSNACLGTLRTSSRCPCLEAVKGGAVGTEDAEVWTELMDVWKGLNEDVKALPTLRLARALSGPPRRSARCWTADCHNVQVLDEAVQADSAAGNSLLGPLPRIQNHCSADSWIFDSVAAAGIGL